MSVGGRTPADLTEIALKGVLFGEPNPMADHHMDFATEIDDPLSPLREGKSFRRDSSAAFGTARHRHSRWLGSRHRYS